MEAAAPVNSHQPDRDPLAATTGCMVGIVFGLLIWIVLIAAVWLVAC